MNNINIPQAIYDKMILHVKDSPNESCGILAGYENTVERIYRMNNVDESPVSYMMDSMEQLQVMKDIRTNGLKMLAIYHSHPQATAYPSTKDIRLAFYSDTVYIIIGFAGGISVRAFIIEEDNVMEVEIIKR